MASKTLYHPGIMAQISYELRIPLTGILGMVHFLKQTPLTHHQRQYLTVLEGAAQRLFGAEYQLQALVKKLLQNRCKPGFVVSNKSEGKRK